MANIFVKKDRHVMPNWRSFENTAELGELNGSKGIQLNSTFKPDISDILDDWEVSKTIATAGDILGVALVSNQGDNPAVKEIAQFVIINKAHSPKAILNAALLVMGSKKGKVMDLKLDEPSIRPFKQTRQLISFHQEIGWVKKKLRGNPNNPILWVEISRFYAILGQQGKAERAMRNAFYLAPENRFVLRNSARFFAHVGDYEFAHDITRKSELVKSDPWVMAAEIALATLRDRGSKFMKLGLQIVDSNSFHPFNISELASSLATVEFKNHSLKKSRKLFDKSLVNPNDNSLAQAEWAEQQDNSLTAINPSEFHVVNSYEALARDAAQHRRWDDAIKFCMQWFLDQPFSKAAVTFGNEIAFKRLKDHSMAVEIAQAGLVSHPNDPQLINNIIYSLCLQNKVDEAETYFSKIRKDDVQPLSIHQVCLTATRGLFYFRKGNRDLGRMFYRESMRISKESNSLYLNSLAFVNYCKEEIRANEIDCTNFVPRLKEIVNHSPEPDLAEEARIVIGLIGSTNK